MRAPKTEKDKSSKRKRVVLTVFTVVVVLAILTTAAFFSESPFLLLPGSAATWEEIVSDTSADLCRSLSFPPQSSS